jgi:catechol 2,3-dioxygenase-like lactoylglutathione lyase family enzyme
LSSIGSGEGKGRAVARSAFSHVGLCVTDLERSKRFYCEVFGFRVDYEVRPSDEDMAQLMSLVPPIDATACYLVRDGLVLELLHYEAIGQTLPSRPRTLNEPGLTQISFAVDDLAGTKGRVRAFGGDVVDESHVDGYVFVQDPDGQLLELVPFSQRLALRSAFRSVGAALTHAAAVTIDRAMRRYTSR